MKFRFKKKDKKIFIIIFVLLAIFIFITFIEYDIKQKVANEIVYKDEEARSVVQEMVVYDTIRVSGWDMVFNLINDNNKSYEIKDKTEEYMTKNLEDMKYKIVQAGLFDDKLRLTLVGENLGEELEIKYDENYDIVSFFINGEELVGNENYDDFSFDKTMFDGKYNE